MKTRQTITQFLKVFLIIGIYLSFFAVQLFFNFDLSKSQKSNFGRIALHNQDATGSKGHTLYQKSSITAKANIRLNKRFEPKSIPDCIAPVFEICFFFYSPKKIGYNFDQSLLASNKLVVLLRGPPAIA